MECPVDIKLTSNRGALRRRHHPYRHNIAAEVDSFAYGINSL